jgi:hypothetical protein
MSKGLLFWIVFILCLLSFLGVVVLGWPSIYSAGVILLLLGLLGWAQFGPPIQ